MQWQNTSLSLKQSIPNESESERENEMFSLIVFVKQYKSHL